MDWLQIAHLCTSITLLGFALHVGYRNRRLRYLGSCMYGALSRDYLLKLSDFHLINLWCEVAQYHPDTDKGQVVADECVRRGLLKKVELLT